MAIIGGGPPGGVSNSFTGTASTIEAMGNGIWAGWSGLKEPNNSTVEAFNFLSPNTGLIIETGWFVNFDGISSGKFLQIVVSLNGTTVIDQKGEMVGTADWPGTFPFVIPDFVIPSQTEVIIQVATDEGVAVPMYITLVGKEI